MSEWITDHGPTEEGEYLVTLEVTGDDGESERWADTRYYAGSGEFPHWTMDGENVDQMHWTEDVCSMPHERVIAWQYLPEPYEP